MDDLIESAAESAQPDSDAVVLVSDAPLVEEAMAAAQPISICSQNVTDD